MANFILYWEREESCRSAYERWLWNKVRVHRGMLRHRLGEGNRGLIWATASGTPWEKSDFALLLGDAGRDPQTAKKELLDAWAKQQPTGDRPILDGLHCLLASGEEGWATAAGDLLGVFPIYYWGDADRVVVASSPKLIEGHPRFERLMDPYGMAGILMTNGLIAGRTLWSNVRRLSPEQKLVWRLGHGFEEVQRPFVNRWTADQLARLSFEEQIDLVHQETERAIRGALDRSSGPLISLLSGGIDSRIATGYAIGAGVKPEAAVTFGRSHDLEAACARLVAKQWQIRHRTVPVYEREAAAGIKSALEWEQLAGGISNAVWIWPGARKIAGMGERFISGMLWDWLCSFVTCSHEDPTYPDTLRARLNWGLTPRQLQLLLGKSKAVALSNWVHEQLEKQWLEGQQRCGHPFWHMLQRLRNRFHIGTVLWSYSHFIWPVGYAFDTRLIGLLSQLPGKTLASRELREQLLLRAAPAVSALPVSTNVTSVRFVQQTENSSALEKQVHTKPFWLRLSPWQNREDLLFYQRLYSFYGHRFWEPLRKRAATEAGLNRFAKRVVKKEGLATVLAAPGLTPLSRDILAETAGLKNLLALQLWHKSRQPQLRWEQCAVSPDATWDAGSLLSNPLRVQMQRASCKNGQWRVQWLFASNRWQQRVNFWFDGHKQAPPHVAEASLIPALLIGMGGSFEEVHSEAPVCQRLLGNAERAEDLLLNAKTRPLLRAQGAVPQKVSRGLGMGAFFTGGVDSCYSAWSLREHLSELVFVHGFDIPLGNHALFNAVHAQIQRLAADLGLELRIVRTDLREATDLYANWVKLAFGGALASVAHLLAGHCNKFVIPASYDAETLIPNGSMPDLDPLWSSKAMEILHHGEDKDRFGKISALRDWKEGLKRLRVCWKNPADAYNCCRCEKCLRTMVALEIAGLSDAAKSFPRRLVLSELETLPLGTPFVAPLWRQLQRLLEQDGKNSALDRAVCKMLEFNQAGR